MTSIPQPRHPSIVVRDPVVRSTTLIWSAEDDDRFSRVIDTLPTTRVQHCAAVIYDLLYDYQQQLLITSVCRMPVAMIAGIAGYSKAAVWRALPQIARAGLLLWLNAGNDQVTVQLTPPDLATCAMLSVDATLALSSRASIIPVALRELEARGHIALSIVDNRQVIQLLRSPEEASI